MTTSWDGTPATPEQLALLGHTTYGSYTFFQVRRGRTHGLSLHLARLRSDALELFGRAPEEQRLRELVAPLTGRDCSVRVTLVSRDSEGVLAGRPVEPEVVVSTSPPRPSSTEPIAVRTVHYERETPRVKHRGTYGPTRQTRAARQAGFDDALFVDRHGSLSEGPTWNACFHLDGTWVWPAADVLSGVTMQLLRQAMEQAGLPHHSREVPPGLAGLHGAVAMNASSPARPISSIDREVLGGSQEAGQQLQELWRTIEPEPW